MAPTQLSLSCALSGTLLYYTIYREIHRPHPSTLPFEQDEDIETSLARWTYNDDMRLNQLFFNAIAFGSFAHYPPEKALALALQHLLS